LGSSDNLESQWWGMKKAAAAAAAASWEWHQRHTLPTYIHTYTYMSDMLF
jgi:hypothetical protein